MASKALLLQAERGIVVDVLGEAAFAEESVEKYGKMMKHETSSVVDLLFFFFWGGGGNTIKGGSSC